MKCVAILSALSLALFAGCVQQPMTHAQWKAEQAKKAQMEQIRREGKAMSDMPIVFTKEEQAQSGKR